MRRVFAALALAALLILTATGDVRAEDPLPEDLKALQGAWVLTRVGDVKVKERIEKVVVGSKETTRIFEASGKLVREQTSDFRLDRAGKIRMYHWTNAVVTEGEQKGTKIPDGSGVYTFREGKWIAVVGLEEEAAHPVYTEVWSRPKE